MTNVPTAFDLVVRSLPPIPWDLSTPHGILTACSLAMVYAAKVEASRTHAHAKVEASRMYAHAVVHKDGEDRYVVLLTSFCDEPTRPPVIISRYATPTKAHAHVACGQINRVLGMLQQLHMEDAVKALEDHMWEDDL